jgi:hypothetical protein
MLSEVPREVGIATGWSTVVSRARSFTRRSVGGSDAAEEVQDDTVVKAAKAESDHRGVLMRHRVGDGESDPLGCGGIEDESEVFREVACGSGTAEVAGDELCALLVEYLRASESAAEKVEERFRVEEDGLSEAGQSRCHDELVAGLGEGSGADGADVVRAENSIRAVQGALQRPEYRSCVVPRVLPANRC